MLEVQDDVKAQSAAAHTKGSRKSSDCVRLSCVASPWESQVKPGSDEVKVSLPSRHQESPMPTLTGQLWQSVLRVRGMVHMPMLGKAVHVRPQRLNLTLLHLLAATPTTETLVKAGVSSK